jgi:LemA protein
VSPLDTRLILSRLYRLPPRKLYKSWYKHWWRRLRTRILDRCQRHATGLVIGSLILAFWIASHVYYYNVLLDFEARTDTAMAQISVAEQKRDHIQRSLTQLLRFHANHERDVLKELTTLRGSSAHAEKPAPSESLARFDAVGEQYPTLQVATTVNQFSVSLVDAETDVAKRIYDYNDAVNMYTAQLQQFPGNLFHKQLGFTHREHYKPQDASATTFREVTP